MKKTILLLLIIVITSISYAQVAITTDGSTPDNSAMLDIKSTSKGILVPRMTATQRDSILSPADGLLVFELNSSNFYYFDSINNHWQEIKSSKNNSAILDTDGDTFITTEQTTDEDTIRIYVKGIEKWRFSGNTLEALNNGASVFIGKSAGMNTTSALNRSVFVGQGAGMSNTIGDGNVAIGQGVFCENTEGNFNVAIGMNTLLHNTSGNNNTALGCSAMEHNITGDKNVAIGSDALLQNTIGRKNISIGFETLKKNINSSSNLSIGYRALKNLDFENGGTAYTGANIAIGSWTLYNTNPTSTSNGIENVAVGGTSLYSNLTGRSNSAFGSFALEDNKSGSYNTALGYKANVADTNFNNTTSIGNQAQVTASNTVKIGNSSITWIGGQVAWSSISKMSGKSNVKEDVKGLDFIMNLRPITYYTDKDAIDQASGIIDPSDYKEKYDIEMIKQSGFIAEEILQASQKSAYDFSAVSVLNKEEGLYGIAYAEFVVPLVKAVQEQQEMIDNYELEVTDNKSKIEAIEKENQTLKDRLDKLEKLLK